MGGAGGRGGAGGGGRWEAGGGPVRTARASYESQKSQP